VFDRTPPRGGPHREATCQVSVVFRGVDLAGRIADVRVDGDVVAAVGENVPMGGAEVMECDGAALIPGLHDHHIHLLALAATFESVDCSVSLSGLATAPGQDWIRGVGYHESVAGPLDRHVLDAVVPHRPVRVQHRSGALWMLNSAGLERVRGSLDESTDVERACSGEPNGRLWRYDERLRTALPDAQPDVATTVRRLNNFGITGVTDATPDLDPDALRLLAEGTRTLAEVLLLGAPDGHAEAGPRKLLLRDHDLPPYAELLDAVRTIHASGRAVAIHCVTSEALVLALAALREAGSIRGDRIEHAAIVPPGLARNIAALGLAVVTQPSFLRLRGDSYLADVPPADHDLLYPYASLIEHGVDVAPSSDAPYGDPDPWLTVRDAVLRATASGRVIGARERVAAATALNGFLSSPFAPSSRPRRVTAGAPGDLVLLDAPLDDVLESPSAQRVRGVLVGGKWSTALSA
jgi:predicted amidohydrolase YtcJ